jgi:hypothetical protein
MKDSTNNDYLLGRCVVDEISAFAMQLFFKRLWENVGIQSIAMGLERLQSNSTPPPSFGDLTIRSKVDLANIWRHFPYIRQEQAGSSIASSADTDGTIYSIDVDFDVTDKLEAMRIAMTPAMAVAKTRGMDKEAFVLAARQLFNTDSTEYQKTLDHIVPDYFVAAIIDEEASASTHNDALSRAATNAFARWCKHKSHVDADMLFLTVFKVK